MVKHLPIYPRACGDCTRCCEGWLAGIVHGHKMHRGCNCHFLERSCKIYEERPENPCKNYNCAWVMEDVFPGWMKPNLSNVIITKRSARIPAQDGMKTIEYYDVIEAGSVISSTVLNWLIHWALDNDINLVYELDGKMHFFGDQDLKKYL